MGLATQEQAFGVYYTMFAVMNRRSNIDRNLKAPPSTSFRFGVQVLGVLHQVLRGFWVLVLGVLGFSF